MKKDTGICECGVDGGARRARSFVRIGAAATILAATLASPTAAASASVDGLHLASVPVALVSAPDAQEFALAAESLAKMLHWIYIDAGYPATTTDDTYDLAQMIALDGYSFGYTYYQMADIINTGGPQNILFELHDYSPVSVFNYYHSYFADWVRFFPNAHIPSPDNAVQPTGLGDEIEQSGHGMYSEAAEHLGIFYPLIRDIGSFFHAMTEDEFTGSGLLGVFSWGLATAWDFTMFGLYGIIGIDQQPIQDQLDADFNSLITLEPLTNMFNIIGHTQDLLDGSVTFDELDVWFQDLLGLLLTP